MIKDNRMEKYLYFQNEHEYPRIIGAGLYYSLHK